MLQYSVLFHDVVCHVGIADKKKKNYYYFCMPDELGLAGQKDDGYREQLFTVHG